MVKGIVFGVLLALVGSLGFIFQPVIAVGALIIGATIVFFSIHYRHELKGPPPNYRRPDDDGLDEEVAGRDGIARPRAPGPK